MAFMVVITNLNLFVASFRNLFDDSIQKIQDIRKQDAYANKDISSALQLSEQQEAEIQKLISSYQSGGTVVRGVADSPQTLLQQKLTEYPFVFNTLPPISKVLIPSIGLEVPLIASSHKEAQDFTQGNFDEELTQWVVKYPTTPDPGTKGNSLIFWHTSQEFWKHNVYGTIFKDIPKLGSWAIIKVLWKWNLFEYRVVDKFVVLPKQVNAQYMTYQNAGGSYITLMGCYPLGTDKKRIMVVAKLVE